MKSFLTALLLSLPLAALAQVRVGDAWVRASVPQQRISGAFMRLDAAQATRLVGATSPVAGRVEIHEMSMQGDVMKMREIDGLDVPVGRSVELKPGGHHLMLMDLKRPLKAGERVGLTLRFEGPERRVETVEVAAEVRAAGGAAHRH